MDVQKKFSLFEIGIILLAMTMIGAFVGAKTSTGSNHDGPIATSNKAVESLCQHTDYKRSCVKSLAHVNNTYDPKELMKIAFKSAIKEMQIAIDSSYTLRALAEDHSTSMALDLCIEALNASIDDLKRSLEKLDKFYVTKTEEYVGDLKIWLSGSLTYQETCREGFENTKGETGQKMKKLLSLGWELTSNGLAMVDAVGGVQLTRFSHGLENKGPDNDAWWVKRMRLDVDLKAFHNMVSVAQDGSGMFRTIMDAVRAAPKKNKRPYVIYIKEGIYNEHVEIPRHLNHVVLYGEGPTKTRITGNINHDDGVRTYKTATVAVNGDQFLAMDIGFENTAGPEKHQAVALRVSGDMAIFHNCAIDGYQDTLYTHSYRQFYRGCNITGTIDFVFGDAAAVFQNCMMIVKKPLENQECMVTAQGRKDRHSKGALILQGCVITADQEFWATKPMPKSYLGRPWKLFARTIIMQSFIDQNIAPEGWAPWDGSFALDTCYFGEFNNKGPRANTAKRVTWKGFKKISLAEAVSYTPQKYIQGDLWIKTSSIPYDPGLM
ncbi:putative pectinesterase [Helianthus debilis subsp. tardiflorus]